MTQPPDREVVSFTVKELYSKQAEQGNHTNNKGQDCTDLLEHVSVQGGYKCG